MKAPDYSSDLFGERDPKRMPRHFFFGAIRMDYGSAARANVSRQNYSVCPRHWYVDAAFVCANCGAEFVFSGSEQRFWFEGMGFWVGSFPTRCPTCRRAERTRTALKKRYDELIGAALRGAPAETQREVIGIINELESSAGKIPRRMRENRSRLCAQLTAHQG